jgi:uncharacterized protein (DUF58 family)
MSRLLDPRVLARLANTQLRARAVVEGVLSGLHRSPHQGQSVEFAEHKEYAPGDELRHIDWKAFGKFDKYYVKRFEHETNLRAYFLVDASGSMAYRGEDAGLSKLEYACTLAATLSYLLIRQQDAVGLVICGGPEIRYLPPRATTAHLPAILGMLEGLTGSGGTDLAAAARFVAEKARRRASVLVLSDLLDFQPRAVERLADLRRMKNEVAVFHVLDRAEIAFPFEDSTRFLGMEGEEQLEVDPRAIRESYLEEIGKLIDGARSACREADVEYDLCPTDEAMDRLALRFLARRERGKAA